MSARSSFALVAALLLVVAQCAEVQTIQNQFKFLLNKAMIEKASSGYKPSALSIPGTELMAENFYSATGSLTIATSLESTCSNSFKTNSIAVDSCITENGISYKFQLVKDTCAGGVVQYFFDDSCSLFAGSSEIEESAMRCGLSANAQYTSLSCSTAAAAVSVLAVAPSAEPTVAPTVRPTYTVTAFPTSATQTVVTFVATQTISGVSFDDYTANQETYDNVLKTSIAATMTGVEPENIINFRVSAGSSRIGNLRAFISRFLQSSSIVANYEVQVTSSLSAEALQSQLTSAVTSGEFTTIMQTNAAAEGATGLETATSDSIETETVVPEEDSDDELSGGAIAGIVIGVVFGTVLIAMAIYYFAFAGGSFGALAGSDAHHVEL